MKITRVELLTNREPIYLAEPWRPAWREPDGEYATNFSVSLYKVYTDQGIIGYGPNLGAYPNGNGTQTGGRRRSRKNRLDNNTMSAVWD